MKNKIFKKLCAVVFVFCLLSGVAIAADEVNVSVPSGQAVGTDYLNAGNTVDVGSDVKGDVMLAGGNVSYSGNATGDILLAGGTVRVKGNSDGDVRIAGGNITLDGAVAKNVTIAGSSVIIEEGSVVNGNLYIGGGNVELRGQVKGNVIVYASQVVFSGKVGGNAEFRSSSVLIRDDARIDGNLTYSSDNEISLKAGTVGGSVTRKPMQNFAQSIESQQAQKGPNALLIIWQFLSLLVMGSVLYLIFHRQAKEVIAPITKEEVWRQVASGFIALILNPLIILFIFITIIGVPLALLLLFAYAIFIICASAISPVLVGRLLNSKLKFYEQKDGVLWVDFVIGYLLMQIIGMIPVLGPLALVFLFLFSFGRVTRYVYGAVKGNR